MALVPLKELIQRRFANPNGAKLQRRQKPQVDEPIYERRVRMEQLTDFFYGVDGEATRFCSFIKKLLT